MNLHRFDVKTIKNVELRRKPFKTAKLQKWSKYNDFHRFDVKNFKTTQNCKSNQITMNYIYITSIKNVDVAKHSNKNYKSDQMLRRKTFKTTQNYKSDQIIMNCIDLTSKRSKMLSYVANHSKPLNYKSDQNTMTFIDLMSKLQNNAKQRKWSNYDEFASIWRPNDQKCWVTSQTIQNR